MITFSTQLEDQKVKKIKKMVIQMATNWSLLPIVITVIQCYRYPWTPVLKAEFARNYAIPLMHSVGECTSDQGPEGAAFAVLSGHSLINFSDLPLCESLDSLPAPDSISNCGSSLCVQL